ncbi:MAG: aldehyde dehydrogenase family protein [Methanomicrobiales archaeon]
MEMLIGGEWIASSGDHRTPVINPSTLETVDHIPAGTPADVHAAVDAARSAHPGWAALPPRTRAAVLSRAAALLRDEAPRLATLLSREQGKPVAEARGECLGAAAVFEFDAGLASALQGSAISALTGGGEARVTREPLGVCGAIIPWNMPVMIAAWKLGASLLCGNAMVLKPASSAPLAVLSLAEILTRAGLPAGVLNVVTGAGAVVGEAIASHPGIRKVSFTGEPETGRRVAAAAAGTPARLTLELGGSDAMIVCADADPDAAARGAVQGRFYNCGQICTAVKRLFVADAVRGDLLPRIRTLVEQIRVGDGLDPATDMGPLHSAPGRDRVARLVDDARQEGARILAGGGIPPEAGPGYFYAPTLIDGVSPDSPLFCEEVFGPVLPVAPFGDLDEAIDLANASPFGLGASVWTRDLACARRAADRLDVGMVWINRHMVVPPEVPFGGRKESGYNRENGIQALDAWTETKTVLVPPG